MSAFATYIFATHTHNDTPAKCLLETKIRICDKKQFKIMKTIPDIPFELMNMILCETEKSWRKDHEKEFFEVMTQLTQIRLSTLVDVVEGFADDVDRDDMVMEEDWLERVDEDRPDGEWFYRPVDVINHMRIWFESMEDNGEATPHYDSWGDYTFLECLAPMKKKAVMSHIGLNKKFVYGLEKLLEDHPEGDSYKISEMIKN